MVSAIVFLFAKNDICPDFNSMCSDKMFQVDELSKNNVK